MPARKAASKTARKSVEIEITISPTEIEDQDEDHSTGLTTKGYERLMDALRSAGFEVTEGPDLVGS